MKRVKRLKGEKVILMMVHPTYGVTLLPLRGVKQSVNMAALQ